MKIIDGKKIAEEILLNIKSEIADLKFQPVFCDILVGSDPASVQYVKIKAKRAEQVGIHFEEVTLPVTITTADLIREINRLNKVENMCGIIVQLPLPGYLDKQIILNAIDPKLDVDCLGLIASSEFYNRRAELAPPAALACMTILDSLSLDLDQKNIVVLGQGQLVGKPVTTLLEFRGVKPIVIQSTTDKKEEIIKKADVLISGIGIGKYITGDMISEGAVLIDAGTSESGSSIVGDIDLESVRNVAGFVSPVPGGVGPVTVAMLLKNVLNVAKKINNER